MSFCARTVSSATSSGRRVSASCTASASATDGTARSTRSPGTSGWFQMSALAARQHQRLQPVLGLGQRLLRRRDGLPEVGDLRLRLDDVDRGQRAFARLPLVARDLALRLRERLRLHVEVAAGKRQVPVRLLDERQLVHHDLRQLRVGEIRRLAREQDLPALRVDRRGRAAAAARS